VVIRDSTITQGRSAVEKFWGASKLDVSNPLVFVKREEGMPPLPSFRCFIALLSRG
jgi:hypothetical protein